MSERDPNPVIFTAIPKPIPMTAKELGCELACHSADKQASILWHWYAEIESWKENKGRAIESWAMQCRNIAEQMTNQECLLVGIMLGTLVEHLAAIPSERNDAELRAREATIAIPDPQALSDFVAQQAEWAEGK